MDLEKKKLAAKRMAVLCGLIGIVLGLIAIAKMLTGRDVGNGIIIITLVLFFMSLVLRAGARSST